MLPVIAAAVLIGGGWFFWDDIQRALKGKKIVILGHAGSGKTSLYHFLKNQEVGHEFSATEGLERVVQKKPVKIPNLKIYMKNCNDWGGKQAYHQDWKNELKDADYVFFLYNMHHLFVKGDDRSKAQVYTEISNAAKAIAAEVRSLNSKEKSTTKIHMVGTHADLVRAEELENYLKHPLLKELSYLFGGESKCPQGQVALNRADSIEKLLRQVIRE